MTRSVGVPGCRTSWCSAEAEAAVGIYPTLAEGRAVSVLMVGSCCAGVLLVTASMGAAAVGRPGTLARFGAGHCDGTLAWRGPLVSTASLAGSRRSCLALAVRLALMRPWPPARR